MNKINEMSFSDLRQELYKCNDPVRKLIIRKIMLEKKKKHIEKKYKKINQIKKKQKILERQFYKEFEDKLNDNLPDFFTQEDLNESYKSNTVNNKEMIDPRIAIREKDQFNKNLMDRLNSDIFIRTHREGEFSHFMTPFTNDGSETFANFKNNEYLPNNNFNY